MIVCVVLEIVGRLRLEIRTVESGKETKHPTNVLWNLAAWSSWPDSTDLGNDFVVYAYGAREVRGSD